MSRSSLIMLLVGVLTSSTLHAENQCNEMGACTAFIPKEKLVLPEPQKTPVWCWAASIAVIFRYHGHPVSQETIVSELLGGPVVTTGNPFMLGKAFNRKWVDSSGKSFTSSARITDLYYGTSAQVSNQDVIDALSNDNPVFFGNQTHAMVLVAVDYIRTPMGPNILAGWVIDPYPGMKFGYRKTAGPELQARYVAIPSLNESHPIDDSIDDVKIKSDCNCDDKKRACLKHVVSASACLEEHITQCMDSCQNDYGHTHFACRQNLCNPIVGLNREWKQECREDEETAQERCSEEYDSCNDSCN